MTDDELLPPSRFPSRICVLSNSLPQHPRIFVFGPSGLEVCFFLMEPQSNGLSVNWNVFFTYPYMCSMPVDWISKIKSKLVVVLWLFRNSRNSFLFDLFLFCFPSVSVCCSRYYYYYYFSIPISMCRRRWWLALNNDDKAPDSPLLDTSWFWFWIRFRTNPSIHTAIHPSIHPSSNPSPSHGGLIIDLLSAFWVCVAQVNGKEIVTDTQNGQHTEMYLGLCFLYLRRPCRYIFEAHASAFLMLLSSI